MSNKDQFVVKIHNLDLENHDDLDIATKNLSKITSIEINIPAAFIVTSNAFKYFLTSNNLVKKINDLLTTIHYERPESVMQVSRHIVKLILNSKIPIDLEKEIMIHYKDFGGMFKRAETLLGPNKTLIRNENNLLKGIKEYWANIFDPKNLLYAHNHKINLVDKKIPILIKKHIKSNKSGTIHTLDLKIETNAKINNKEADLIVNLGKKLKKHFYLPHTAEWIIHKNKVFIVDIKPST